MGHPAKNKVTHTPNETWAGKPAPDKEEHAGRVPLAGKLFNYFNYFTEIEEYFWKKRGAHLLVSPLDWAILETWQKAGIPLRAVQKGIDRAFEAYGRSKRKRPIKSLAYCVDAVLDAAREMSEAAVGKMQRPATSDPSSSLWASQRPDASLSAERIARFLEDNANLLRQAAQKAKIGSEGLEQPTGGQRPPTREELGHRPPGTGRGALGTAFDRTAHELNTLATSLGQAESAKLETRNSKLDQETLVTGRRPPACPEPAPADEGSPVAGLDLEDLERRLTVLEEKLTAAITANLGEEELLEIRREMDRALVPYRRKMTADQLALLERQYSQRKLFEHFRLPRLSLFYLG